MTGRNTSVKVRLLHASWYFKCVVVNHVTRMKVKVTALFCQSLCLYSQPHEPVSNSAQHVTKGPICADLTLNLYLTHKTLTDI